MNQKAIIARLIVELNKVLTRQAMFLGEITVASAISFGGGIYCACAALDITLTTELRSEATNSCGWQFSPTGSVDHMREQGLTEEQIVHELVLIEIKMLEIVAAGL
ncbi:MAG: hypothetical protein ACRYFS_11115 [Janthinobacterium lividum]